MVRVLILYSWDDEISQDRYEIISASPRIRGYIFNQCFALENPSETVTTDQLCQRVSKAIGATNPDVVLLHTGAAFHRTPDIFIECFEKLKEKFPQLRFGYERWRNDLQYFSNITMFEDSSEMREIENLFFRRVFGGE